MLIHITTAPPPYAVHQAKATEELKQRMAVRPAVGRMIDAASLHSGIETRRVVLADAEPSTVERFYPTQPGTVGPDTKTRMTAYERWAKVLTVEAVTGLLEETRCDPSLVRRLITISCTGFFAPGIDHHLIRHFQFPASIQRTHIGFMGCAAALVGFTSVLEAMHAANGGDDTTLLVAVELCSLHLQTEPTRDNILANIIFADGCAAALFSSDNRFRPRLKLVRTRSHLFPDSADIMGWKIGNLGFEMMLSSELPNIVASAAVPALRTLFAEQGISPEAVNHWALHPGGRAVLDALQQGLHLSEEAMLPSRTVLKQFGNMSSATILYVLKELLATHTIRAGELVCAVAFGPGLTMEVAFLEGV